MKHSINEIVDAQEKILVSYLNYNYLINPFFRISKATPEQTKKFRAVLGGYPRLLIIIMFFMILPTYFLRFILYSIFSLVSINQHKTLSYLKYRNMNLFLSHATSGNLQNAHSDTFFIKIPQTLNVSSSETLILYTNQHTFGYKNNTERLIVKSDKFHHVILPKFLRPLENMSCFFIVNRYAFTALRVGCRFYFTEPLISKILFASTFSFFSRKTYVNFSLQKRINDFCKSNTLQTVFLTFEGHSYEQLVIDTILSTSPSAKICLYQHSPIVIEHHGIRHFLNSHKGNVHIFTTGKLYKEYFSSISATPMYYILGTEKVLKVFDEPYRSKKKSILFCPEGTRQSTADYIKLIMSLCGRNEKKTYVLRLHPDFHRNLFTRFKLARLHSHQNFRLSSGSLLDDLKTASYVVYTSSATGIQALGSNSILIYFDKNTNPGLNVLHNFYDHFFKVSNVMEFEMILSCSVPPRLKSDRVKVLNSFFSPVNYDILS